MRQMVYPGPPGKYFVLLFIFPINATNTFVQTCSSDVTTGNGDLMNGNMLVTCNLMVYALLSTLR